MDLKNDIWTVEGAHDTSVNVGSRVPFNTILGFRHQAIGTSLHSHSSQAGTTPISKHQQGILKLLIYYMYIWHILV